MEKTKKIVSILLVLMIAIVIIIVIAVISIKNSEKGTDYQETEFESDTSNEKLQDSVDEVTNRNEYYAVKNIIGKYAYAIIDGGNQSIYNMLSKEYITDNNINENNVRDVVEKVDLENLSEYQLKNYKLITSIEKMLYIQSEVNIKSFFVYGNFSNNINKDKTNFKIIVQMDSRNNTFSIYPTSYTEKKYSDENNLKNYSIDIEQIEENQYNTFSFVNISDTTVINDYITIFKNSLLNLNEESYNLLNEDYKNKKFADIEEYKKYVNKHLKDLLSINIEKYQKNEIDNETEYICLDTNGNYIILNENSIMKFNIMLDTYTTVLPEFTEKYDKLDNNKKVAMNIEKVVQALNLKDCNYIYENLDETFKKNNYPTVQDFEKYITENYPSKYELEYSTYSEENDIYTQNIILNDTKSEESKNLTIIMKLKDNYEYVMSFSAE